jgi:hypothetical protein
MFITGVIFAYYLSKMMQFNDNTELRAKRRTEDVAFYLSKLEEQYEDVQKQVQKKIDKTDVDNRIKLTLYENTFGKTLNKEIVKKNQKMELERIELGKVAAQ